jgi:hypothetical protein
VAVVIAAGINATTGAIRYAVRFPCGHRRVLREGEVYLEKAKNQQRFGP